MSRSRMTVEQRRELAQAVEAGRQGGLSWKALERVYGRSRVQLWRYARESLGMKHNSPAMKHLSC